MPGRYFDRFSIDEPENLAKTVLALNKRPVFVLRLKPMFPLKSDLLFNKMTTSHDKIIQLLKSI